MPQKFTVDVGIRVGDEAYFKAPGTEILVTLIGSRTQDPAYFREMLIKHIHSAEGTYASMKVGDVIKRAVLLDETSAAPWGLDPI